jgi:predicted DNA-binding transcriptional regulator YafY
LCNKNKDNLFPAFKISIPGYRYLLKQYRNRWFLFGREGNKEYKPLESEIQDIILRVDKKSVPYVLSKPIHSLQKTTKHYKNGDIQVKIPLYINYELVSTILTYQNTVEIIAPNELRLEVLDILRKGIKLYE